MDLLQAVNKSNLGDFGVIFIAATLFMFSFSTFLGILFYARSNVSYLFETSGAGRPHIKCWRLSCCLSEESQHIYLCGILEMWGLV